MTTELPNVGSVIKSQKFAYGFWDEERKIITVDGKTTKKLIVFRVSEEERLGTAAAIGTIPPKTITEDFGAYDPTRAGAKFVVERAELEGGSRGWQGDDYPDGWHILARRLKNDGSYDPNGEIIQFYMSGCFLNLIEPKDVEVIGKMQMRFM